MSYAKEIHYKWVESATGQKCSPLGRQVANILGYAGRGIYNAPVNVKRVDWSDEYCLDVVWSGDMANWDFPQLSLLWVECHRRMLRVCIDGCAPGRLRLRFHQRKTREGCGMERLPDCEEMIAMIDREWKGARTVNSACEANGGSENSEG
jgi:hypothetical protein